MFSGIVEEIGTVESATDKGGGRDVVIAAEAVLADLKPSDSINVDGVCQTVVDLGRRSFKVQTIATTLSRTTFGEFRRGREVNLERPIAAGQRFGGHFVQGHVDGVGTVTSVQRQGDMWLVRFTLPDTVEPFTILHGSIAVDGVSLTINALPAAGTAEVALIPYTYEHTNLSRLAPGDKVNLEADMIGKYVARTLGEGGARDAGGDLQERLSSWGIE
ncbi:MAG: riboflavin synthase [Gemmatimonadetes bacterium]|nr:riboflavin synthase [Gemmatimonadota bacterium]NIO32530.1 riboflavin synthase [Gemmatimonadota bacterium]